MPETKFKRKKNSRQRSTVTHGSGSMKKKRGAGHRGGRGNAGSGKRGDSNKPTHIIAGRRFGRFGFVGPSADTKVVNVGDIQKNITKRVEAKKMKAMDSYEIDLSKQKIDKLLGTGDVTDKLVISVGHASATAISKIEAAGGKVTITKTDSASSDKE